MIQVKVPIRPMQNKEQVVGDTKMIYELQVAGVLT